MNELGMTIRQIVSGFIGAGGLAFIQFLINRADAKKGNQYKQNQVLIGLAHDRIVWLGGKYIERGFITKDEYENLSTYLYEPYKAIGGDGTAEKIMKEVDKLPMREGPKEN